MDDSVYYAALSWNEAIGPKRYEKIMNEFLNLHNFFNLSTDEMMNYLGIKNKNLKKIFNEMLPAGEEIVKKCRQNNIKMINREDISYHPRLKEIPDAPFLYYQIGQAIKPIKLTAVIGTRNASREGICANEYFTRELVSYNIGITSGLAIGHDSIAHRTALSNGGFTVAVLGSGIDIIYPEEHKRLYDEICKKGAIISEYPPGTPPLKTHFPIRNRIISGLSEAVLLIQAPEKSGALITAKCAEIQNRELLVCPGNPADPRNRGSNNLIRIGAKIAIEPFDVIREILGNNPKKINEMLSINENNLTDEEKFLLDKLSGETLIDDLIGISGMSLAKINHLLNTMEMRGLVTQYPGRIYSRKIP